MRKLTVREVTWLAQLVPEVRMHTQVCLIPRSFHFPILLLVWICFLFQILGRKNSRSMLNYTAFPSSLLYVFHSAPWAGTVQGMWALQGTNHVMWGLQLLPHDFLPFQLHPVSPIHTQKEKKNSWTKPNTDTISNVRPHSSLPPHCCYGKLLPTGTKGLGPRGKAGCMLHYSSHNHVWAREGHSPDVFCT